MISRQYADALDIVNTPIEETQAVSRWIVPSSFPFLGLISISLCFLARSQSTLLLLWTICATNFLPGSAWLFWRCGTLLPVHLKVFVIYFSETIWSGTRCLFEAELSSVSPSKKGRYYPGHLYTCIPNCRLQEAGVDPTSPGWQGSFVIVCGLNVYTRGLTGWMPTIVIDDGSSSIHLGLSFSIAQDSRGGVQETGGRVPDDGPEGTSGIFQRFHRT